MFLSESAKIADSEFILLFIFQNTCVILMLLALVFRYFRYIERGMKTKTRCFTGHRILPNEHSEQIQQEIENTVLCLIEQGCRYFLDGGAQGYDTLAALAVLKIKEQHPSVQLILILPHIYKREQRTWEHKYYMKRNMPR